MATVTAPALASSNFDPDDAGHLYCCDENAALCGADLTGMVDVDPDDSAALCPLCVLVDERAEPCRVVGCGM